MTKVIKTSKSGKKGAVIPSDDHVDAVIKKEQALNTADIKRATKPKTKTVKAKSSASLPAPVGAYVPGALSGLFGQTAPAPFTESKGDAAVPDIYLGETKIERKIKAEVKTEQPEECKKTTVKHTVRVEQRENRKKGKDAMSAEEKKATIFVGNMPLTYNERSVKKIFSDFGEVESVRERGVMPTKETVSKRVAHLSGQYHEKQNSIFFYVKFKDAETVKKALEFNGTTLEGHRIRVDSVVGSKDYDKNLAIFVGNLPFDATDDSIAAFFEEAVGSVNFVRVVRDNSSGMGKGFAFVVFKDSSSVDLAIGMTGLQFMKRDLRITKIMKKNKVRIGKKHAGGNAQISESQQSKSDSFKFSTKKSRSEDQNQRRGLKKTAKRAIQKKKAGKQGKSVMQ